MSRYLLELKITKLRTILSLVFVLAIILGVNGQSETDTSEQEQISILRYHLEDNALSINDIEIDNNNRLVVATDKMLLTIGNANDKHLKYLQGSYLSCATTDKKNNLYAAGKNQKKSNYFR